MNEWGGGEVGDVGGWGLINLPYWTIGCRYFPFQPSGYFQ